MNVPEGFEGIEDFTQEMFDAMFEALDNKKKKPSIDNDTFTDIDEEEYILPNWRTGQNDDIQDISIVPDNIGSARVVALVYENRIFAYRFKTDVGDFDITIATAAKYGLSRYRVTKAIKLNFSNGIYATNSELARGLLVPDVSDNDEDCRKLFAALSK